MRRPSNVHHQERAFLLVTALTLGNATFGFLALLLATTGRWTASLIALSLAIGCDTFDGMLARKWGVTSPFGAVLDTLADMISFGVVPAYGLFVAAGETTFAASVATAYVVSGLLRLATFQTTSFHGTYRGIPITVCAAAFVICSFVHASTFVLLLVACGSIVLMHAPFDIKKPTFFK